MIKWDDVSYVLRSPLSKQILKALSEADHLTPSEIAKITRISLSNVSTKLIELQKRKMVICLNPESKKFRFYKITDYGRRMLKEGK
jgi:DNA-binding MarR family transcriptional regulator